MLDQLPLDVVYRILTFGTNFRQTAATILVSPRVYDVFKVFQNSVVAAVALNIAGPVLPEAMNYVRFTCVEGRDEYLSPPEPNSPDFPINRSEAEALVESVRLVIS